MIRRFASVKFLYAWLASTGLRADNPCAGLRFRLPNRTPKPPFSLDDLRALLGAARTVRDRALMLVFIGSGCRLGEMAGMRWEDVDFGEREAILVRGKGQRHRWVASGRSAMEALSVLQHDPKCCNVSQSDLIWRSRHRGKALTEQGMYLAVKRIAARAGVTSAFPRRFRTTMACDFDQETGDLLSLMKVMGHAKITTTQVYAEWNAAERALAQQRRYSLADRLGVAAGG